MFVSMVEYLEENCYALEEIKPHVLNPLTDFESSSKNWLPGLIFQQIEWIRNPFGVNRWENELPF
jgi:hypothetical protein